MRIVKKLALFLSLFSLIPIAGCGGSGDNPRIAVTPRFVPVTVGLQWPVLTGDTTTRLVAAPSNALSVVVSITDLSKNPAGENDLVAVATINRDTTNSAAYTQNFTTKTVVARPNTDTFAELRFYSAPNGTGDLVGFAKKRTTLPANGNLGDFDVATAITQN